MSTFRFADGSKTILKVCERIISQCMKPSSNISRYATFNFSLNNFCVVVSVSPISQKVVDTCHLIGALILRKCNAL